MNILPLKSTLIMIGVLLAVASALSLNPAAAQDELLTYVRWQEPSSQAFTAEVPAGWTVTGSASVILDVATVQLRVTAPDSSAIVLYGAPQSSLYVEPNVTLGLAEGETGTVSSSVRPLTVAYYQQPVDYLSEYLRSVALADTCAQLEIVSEAQPASITFDTQRGELTVDCTSPDGVSRGTFAITLHQGTDPQLGSVWSVVDFQGYLAAPEAEAEAIAALTRISTTLNINGDIVQMATNTSMLS